MLSIVPSYKEQFLRLCRSRLYVAMSSLHTYGCLSFFFKSM